MKNLLPLSLIAFVLLFIAGACEDGDLVDDPIEEGEHMPYTLNFFRYADTVNLIAGQSDDVGEVQIWHDFENLYVKYIVDDENDWCLTETHIHIAESEEEIPQNNDNPVPGQFDYSTEHDDCLKEFTDTIEDYEVVCGESLIIAAHAAVEQRDENGEVVTDEDGEVIEETAWGEGDAFTDQGNWATYFELECMAVWPGEGTVSIAYEDKPMDEGNDWDYNDFVVDIDLETNFIGEPDDLYVKKAVFTVRPETKTASYTHSMHLSKDDFDDCGGTYNLYRDGNPVDENVSFDGSIDVELIENTGEPPDKVVLEVLFDESGCQIDLDEWDEEEYHGESLFFDPYLVVHNTKEEIHTGDVRMLTVPADWQWPTPDQNPVWCPYPDVDEPEEEGEAPQFSPWWWENYDEDADCTN